MARGKRYTEEQRQEVIQFARAHDKKNGRGGKAAAAKKFGVNVNSITNWMSSSKKQKTTRTKTVAAAAPSVKASSSSEVDMLERMLKIQQQIEELNSEYKSIKSKL